MLVPQKVINGMVYALDQASQFIGVASVDLPEVSNMTETMTGFGLSGEYEAPVLGHFQDSTLTLHFHTITPDAYKLSKQQVRQLEVRTSIQFEDTSAGIFTPIAARYVFKTHPKSIKFGKIEPAKSQDLSVDMSVISFTVYYNDKRVMQFDKFNFINEVDGTDNLYVVRQQLGLG
jgi:uncharacterized protein